ncbi:hypothetical protein TorRG33x02_063890 [Trema orientale]|uniref:Uncharacterized protein n=1 Tax=Trema orientale TaxID=63057 RepID=A0A2P5FJ34_TREOI|nr:hypothetical protein TorRG33x02_063890 [Trema orientale]
MVPAAVAAMEKTTTLDCWKKKKKKKKKRENDREVSETELLDATLRLLHRHLNWAVPLTGHKSPNCYSWACVPRP